MAGLIRQAVPGDLARIAEIEVFNYRLNFYPIFRNDWFYFDELQVPKVIQQYQTNLSDFFVYDDGVVKGFIRLHEQKILKLFVEPVLQGMGIGAALIRYAIEEKQACSLWALEKNTRAISFYQRHGFRLTGERKHEEDTTEYLVRLVR